MIRRNSCKIEGGERIRSRQTTASLASFVGSTVARSDRWKRVGRRLQSRWEWIRQIRGQKRNECRLPQNWMPPRQRPRFHLTMISHDIATSERGKTNNAECTERRYFTKARVNCRQAGVSLRRPSLEHENVIDRAHRGGEKKANRSEIGRVDESDTTIGWRFHDPEISVRSRSIFLRNCIRDIGNFLLHVMSLIRFS